MKPKVVVTEENFNLAVNNASKYARQRLNKKMEKRIWRPLRWEGSFKIVKSPLTGEPLRVLDLSKQHGVGATSRPPRDLEEWVSNWVQINMAKTDAEKQEAKDRDIMNTLIERAHVYE